MINILFKALFGLSIIGLLKNQALRILILLNVLSIIGLSLGLRAGTIQNLNYTNDELQRIVDDKLENMSVEDKVGQLFILGFHGTKYSKKIKRRINKFNPGSVIIYKRNISSLKQIQKFNFDLQKNYSDTNEFPIFIMTDQEGGSVSRIKNGFTPPSALSVGQTNQPIYSMGYGLITGEIMGLLGFNFNLAPVADLSNPYKRNFIGNRSFGNNPQKVLSFAQQFAQGLVSASVIPTFKHYPGHGGIITDSHRKLPQKLSTLSELENTHLYPFKKIAELDMPSAIMTAHISFPNIDPSETPATFSKILITDILRTKFGYNGLVITDDLRMSGATKGTKNNIGKRALKSFLAGCDMLMLAWGYKKQDQAKRYLVSAVEDGQITEQRLNESLKRILKYKFKYSSQIFKKRNSLKKLRLAFKELKNFSNEISLKNFKASVLKNKKRKNSLKDESLLAQPKSISVFSAYRSFYNNLRVGQNIKKVFHRLKPNQKTPIESILSGSNNKLGIFYISGLGTSKLLKSLSMKVKKKLLVVNTTYPGILDQPQQFYGVININTKNTLSAKWTGENLISEAQRTPSNFDD